MHLFAFYRRNVPYCLYNFLKGAYSYVSHQNQNQRRTQQNEQYGEARSDAVHSYQHCRPVYPRIRACHLSQRKYIKPLSLRRKGLFLLLEMKIEGDETSEFEEDHHGHCE